MEPMKTSKEIAELLGVTPRRIQQLTSQDFITCDRVDGKRRYNENLARLEYEAYLTEHQRGGKLLGEKFGDLEVIGAEPDTVKGRTKYTCRCNLCGRIVHPMAYELKSGKKERCAYCEKKRQSDK